MVQEGVPHLDVLIGNVEYQRKCFFANEFDATASKENVGCLGTLDTTILEQLTTVTYQLTTPKSKADKRVNCDFVSYDIIIIRNRGR